MNTKSARLNFIWVLGLIWLLNFGCYKPLPPERHSAFLTVKQINLISQNTNSNRTNDEEMAEIVFELTFEHPENIELPSEKYPNTVNESRKLLKEKGVAVGNRYRTEVDYYRKQERIRVPSVYSWGKMK